MSEVTIRLREWQSVAPDPDSPTHGRFLPQDPATRSLTDSLSREGVLDIQELRRGLHLKASSFVGFLSIGDLRIVIEPKIQGMQLMKLLRYAYGLRDLRLLTRVAPSVGEDSFLDLLIQQLLAESQELIARGLHRRYEPVAARLATPRGRLDLQTLARHGIISAELPCRYHPRVEDCLHNQVLLAGLRLAAEIARDRDLRSELRRTASVLETTTVSRIRLNATTIDKLRRQMNRLTVAYEPAISLIEILLDSSGISLQGVLQEPRLPGFLFDMNRFFQRLLGRFLRENLPADHQVLDEKAIKGMMAYPTEYNPRDCRAPALKPDYSVTKDRKTLLLDAKYRDLWSEGLPREMLYQLAIYALSQKPPGRATILYPTMDSAASDAIVRIYEPSSGNMRAEVVQRPVNLARLADLLTPGPGIIVARQRQEFASRLLANPS